MDEYPHTRRLGAYLFFALCSFGVSMLAYAFARRFGFNDSVTHLAASTAMIATFLALRDMTARPPTAAKESRTMTMRDDELVEVMARAIGLITGPIDPDETLDQFMLRTWVKEEWPDLRSRAAIAALAAYRNATQDDGK